MKRFWRATAALSSLAALAALSAFSARPARAESVLDSNQWIIKAGVNLPTDGDVKAVGKEWFAGGAEYVFGNPDKPVVHSLEALYTGKSATIHSFGLQDVIQRDRMVSLMFNRKYRRLGPGLNLGNVLYYGGGIGADFVHLEVEDPNPGGEGNIKEDRTFAGANLFIGYEFAANVQAEAKYQFVLGQTHDRRMDGLQFLVGIKF